MLITAIDFCHAQTHAVLQRWHIYVAQRLLSTVGLHSCIANSTWRHLAWLDLDFATSGTLRCDVLKDERVN